MFLRGQFHSKPEDVREIVLDDLLNKYLNKIHVSLRCILSANNARFHNILWLSMLFG